MPLAQVQVIGGHIGGGVEKNVPTSRSSFRDPSQGVLHPGKVGLSRVSEQVVTVRSRAVEEAIQHGLVDPHLRRRHRNVSRRGAPSPVELSDAVHRVVIVEGEKELIVRFEGIGLADQPQKRHSH